MRERERLLKELDELVARRFRARWGAMHVADVVELDREIARLNQRLVELDRASKPLKRELSK